MTRGGGDGIPAPVDAAAVRPSAVLRELEGSDPRWDAFVDAHPEGSVHHLLAWRRIIERAFGHAAHYLYVERGARWAGVLPLFAVGGRPFSRALVSVPVGVSGGVLAEDDEAALLLREGARALAEREGAEYVEYKSERARFPALATKDDLYFTFRQELLPERDKQLGLIPRKTRAMIREAERARLKAGFNREDLDAFIDLYALSLRNLGTPMFPRELFVASLEELPAPQAGAAGAAADLLTVRQTGRIIGAVLNFYYKGVMLPFFAGALPEARDVAVNNYLYWAMLETGRARGFHTFDFGRSKAGTGAYAFKKHFGMKEIPLSYQYELVRRSELPNFNPTNPKYARAIQLWQRLPLSVTRVLGPALQRRLP